MTFVDKAFISDLGLILWLNRQPRLSTLQWSVMPWVTSSWISSGGVRCVHQTDLASEMWWSDRCHFRSVELLWISPFSCRVSQLWWLRTLQGGLWWPGPWGMRRWSRVPQPSWTCSMNKMQTFLVRSHCWWGGYHRIVCPVPNRCKSWHLEVRAAVRVTWDKWHHVVAWYPLVKNLLLETH